MNTEPFNESSREAMRAWELGQADAVKGGAPRDPLPRDLTPYYWTHYLAGYDAKLAELRGPNPE